MSSSRVTYTPRPDATPESEIAVLADIYAFIIRCAEEKKSPTAGPSGRGENDGTETKEESADANILH